MRIFVLWKAVAEAKNDVNRKYFMPNQSKNYYSTGLDRSRRYNEVEASIFRKSAHKDNKDVSPTQRLPLPSRKYSYYSEAESTAGPQRGWKGYVNEKPQLHHGESNLLCSDVSTNCPTTCPAT